MNVTHTPFKDTWDAAVRIYAITISEQGGTFNDYGYVQEFKSGYIVANKVTPTWIVESDLQAIDNIARFIEITPRVGESRPLIGTWLHEDQIYLDTVEHVDNLIEAQALGIARHELAIWDCQNKAEIEL